MNINLVHTNIKHISVFLVEISTFDHILYFDARFKGEGGGSWVVILPSPIIECKCYDYKA